MPEYLGSYDTNYIICKSVDFLKNIISKEQNFVKEKYRTLYNNIVFDNEFSK